MKAVMINPVYPPIAKKQVVLGAQPDTKALVKVQAEPTPRKSS
jgi:hypothetical protein